MSIMGRRNLISYRVWNAPYQGLYGLTDSMYEMGPLIRGLVVSRCLRDSAPFVALRAARQAIRFESEFGDQSAG